MCEIFKNDERGYGRWPDANQTGFVFNHFGGGNSSYNKLHHVPCHAINKPSQTGRWTVVEKVCCSDRVCLERTIRERRGGPESWEGCSVCG